MMKKWIFIGGVFSVLLACNSNSGGGSKSGADATDLSANPDYQKGVQLVANAGCPTCHGVENKINGPAYRDIANKYAGESGVVPQLATKIIQGGSGVWGEVPMIPHPDISQADAEAMVKYILLLKK